MKFSLVVAVDQEFGIGKNNTMPWRLPSDLKYFSDVTTGVQYQQKTNAVIMGRKTWDSLPEKHRPLKNRVNIVLSRGELTLPEGVLLFHSLEEALKSLEETSQQNFQIENVFVIGGANIFAQAIDHPDCQTIYLTQIEQTFNCDTFFPKESLQKNFSLKSTSEVSEENGLKFSFKIFEKNA
ncbi:MAG: dihydrofolate reductase [Candidatus Gracilibacteria bacterium]|jgi:dihydrofolate reductase